MADIIALLALGLQYWLIIFLIRAWFHMTLSFVEVAIAFLILVCIGIVLWHGDTFAQRVNGWRKAILTSIVLGVAFFGVDFLIALLKGHQANPFHFPGGLLGLPLTFLICPGGTIICLAGLVRAAYLTKRSGSRVKL